MSPVGNECYRHTETHIQTVKADGCKWIKPRQVKVLSDHVSRNDGRWLGVRETESCQKNTWARSWSSLYITARVDRESMCATFKISPRGNQKRKTICGLVDMVETCEEQWTVTSNCLPVLLHSPARRPATWKLHTMTETLFVCFWFGQRPICQHGRLLHLLSHSRRRSRWKCWNFSPHYIDLTGELIQIDDPSIRRATEHELESIDELFIVLIIRWLQLPTICLFDNNDGFQTAENLKLWKVARRF